LTGLVDTLPFGAAILDNDQELYSNDLFDAQAKSTIHSVKLPGDNTLMLHLQPDNRSAELLDILAHQLRTPVTGILWNAELADQKSREDMQDLLANIQESAQKLQRTVADLILALELQHEKSNFSPEPTEIRDIIVAASKKLDFADKQVQITYSQENSHSPTVDRQQLTIALQHILQNSIDYADQEEINITINANCSTDECTITCTDNGTGLKDPVKKLLRQYARGSQARTSKPDGSGLGLYIAERISALHQGKLTLESVEQGTKATLKLPADLHKQDSKVIIN